MQSHRIIDRSTIFMDDTDILVMNAEHDGKVTLHSHSFFEFVYVDSGYSLHTCNGIIKILTAGDLFAMRPEDIHSYDSAHNTKIYNCLFTVEALEWIKDDVMKLPGIDRLFTEHALPWKKISLGPVERHEIVLTLEKMKWEGINRGLGWQINLKALLAGFLVLYSRLYVRQHENEPETADRAYSKYIYRLLEFIESNYMQDISTSDLARYAGLSTDYLTKQFKSSLGISPAEYLRNYRIAKAMEMLKSTDSSVADISAALGFSGVGLFSRQFKAILGITPTDFRRNIPEQQPDKMM